MKCKRKRSLILILWRLRKLKTREMYQEKNHHHRAGEKEAVQEEIKTKIEGNLGYGYTTSKGIQKGPKTLGALCICKRKCRDSLMGKENKIFHAFWNLKSRHQQNNYLFARIKGIPKQRCYPKKTKRQRYAKTSFWLSMVCISRRNEFILYVVKSLEQNLFQNAMLGEDTKTKKIKYQKRVRSVHEHIRAILKYSSHYSRQDNPNRVYLNHDMSISSLYRDYYVPWCKEHNNVKPVKEDYYRRIFCQDYSIGFKLPKTDTCQTCDKYNVHLESNKDDLNSCREINMKLAGSTKKGRSHATKPKKGIY
nr:unnamed protein product [Callosobruchus analis]